MSNRRRRAELKAAAAEASIREQLATPRQIDAPFGYAGAGMPLVRLAWLPSFEIPMLWEVCSDDGALAAYRSQGRAPGEDLVVGHERLALQDAALRAAIDRLSLVNLSLTPSLPDSVIADGDRYVATIQVGIEATCRMSWVVGSEPKGWLSVIGELVALKELMESAATGSMPSASSSQITCVHCKASTVQLVRLGTGEFQVWDAGVFGSLLCGFDYILATASLADALQAACGEEIVVRDAKIIRPATGESWSAYREIIPLAELEGPDDLPRARLSTTRVWHYQRGNLFVDGKVRKSLAAVAPPDITFSAAQFVGHREY